MKLSILTLAASAVMAAANPASAHDVVYIGTLSNLGEASPAGGPSLGTGSVIVTLNEDTFAMRVQVSYSGLTGTTTASHVHCCTSVAGVGTAGVASVTPSFTGFVTGQTAGSYDNTFDMSQPTGSWNNAFITANGGTPGAAFSALLAGVASGKAYLNIHTTAVPSGEIRAFLAAAPVPEPETYALMLAGLGLVGWAARRRQQA